MSEQEMSEQDILGQGILYSKTGNGQRRRIDVEENNVIDKIIIKNVKMNELKNKYFQKIVDSVIGAIYKEKNSINFYYNYYDFTNKRIGKPHGLLNEFMYEMCYEYSTYVNKDLNNNNITFKTLFGQNFKWQLFGKNKMVISW